MRTKERQLWLASVSAAAIGLSFAGVASAQQAAPAPAPEDNSVTEVVVTGFRSSLDKALNVKRSEAAAVDSILAEDIGKFPDLNLSESIQRIPGVALARDGGEGRQISVRGLGPQFTRVRINGMEALTTAGGADASGGTNRGRSFDFNVFASDLFNAITVRKTAEAGIEEGSLGATVDLRTARPFDYKGFTMVGSAQLGYNDLAKSKNPRGAFMIANTWGDGKFGALLSVAYSRRKLLDEGSSTVRWATGNAFSPGFNALPNGAGLPTTVNPAEAANNAAFHPRFPRFDIYKDDQKRLGGTLSLQYAPTDRTEISFDALYADFKGTREEQYLEAPSFSVGGACTAANVATSCGIAQTQVVSATIDSTTNTMTKGVFNNVDLRVEDRFDKLDTKFTQFGLSGKHHFTDDIQVEALIGHSKSDHQNPIQTTVQYDQFNIQGYSYDYTQGRNPVIGYGNAKLTDPNAWVLTQIRIRPQSAVNTYDVASIDGTWDNLGIFKLSAGASFKKYDFETTEFRRSNGTSTNIEPTVPAALVAIDKTTYGQVVNFAGFNSLIPDTLKAASVLSLYDQTAYGGTFKMGKEPALGNNRGVREKDNGGYVQADWNTDLGSWPFRGNVGVRYVETQQDSDGYTYVSGAPLAISASRKYHDTLPSLNMVLEPRDNFLIRFGAAKVMARPDLGSLTPGATVSVSGAGRSVSAGNPNLDPFRAKAYDLSFEWYFKKSALLSLALFQKDINSLVQTLQTNTTFTGNPFGLPDSVAIAACGTTNGCSPSAQWQFSTPVNTPGGTLKGFEINYQQPFSFLPGALRHTGVLLNYTGVKSEIQYLNGAGAVIATGDLTGLSRSSYNATLYYEDSKFSARVSAAYRDNYLTRIPGSEAGTNADGTKATLNVDASLQYTLNEHFKLSLEGVNLTDEYQDQFNDSVADRSSFYHHTGREFILGLRYTF
ncbi:TonB-dependent receptor [Caulobacter sp.]|uniref:TonB-dependent receptor n=1 Tax=Caulobacter sp. TaxID=78 RepID=UPI001B1A5DDE|nr:TonB-dependent receptor [Caulobacter sp.]MBO9544565.1 TonB-dependent receptor [Caulobacter sp.]